MSLEAWNCFTVTYVNVPGNQLASQSAKPLVPCLERNRLNYLKSWHLKLGRGDRVHLWHRGIEYSCALMSPLKSSECTNHSLSRDAGRWPTSMEEIGPVVSGGLKKLESDSYSEYLSGITQSWAGNGKPTKEHGPLQCSRNGINSFPLNLVFTLSCPVREGYDSCVTEENIEAQRCEVLSLT